MTHYKFPEGTLQISAEEMHQALCNYEEVEVPGSVSELRIMEYDQRIITQKLILNEGTLYVDLHCYKNIEYNIPQSVIEFTGPIKREYGHLGLHAPRVLCLSHRARKIYGLCGVEYLQAYSCTDIRYFDLPDLKHFVLLGTDFPKKMIGNLAKNCVIHVETLQMAEHMLTQVDVFNTYVIPDAKEWKDFPADKQAMSLEDYNPESRILPKQKQLREEKMKQQAELSHSFKKIEKTYKKRQMMEQMARQVIGNALSQCEKPVVPPHFSVDTGFDGAGLHIHIWIAMSLWPETAHKDLIMNCVTEPEDIIDKLTDIKLFYRKLYDFIETNQEFMKEYRIILDEDRIPNHYESGLSLIFQNRYLLAALNLDNLQEDVNKIRKFKDEFQKIIEEGKKAFPKGFSVRRTIF